MKIARARKRDNEFLSDMLSDRPDDDHGCEECTQCRDLECELEETQADLDRLNAALDGQIGALKRIRSEMRGGPARELADEIERTLDRLDPCWRAA